MYPNIFLSGRNFPRVGLFDGELFQASLLQQIAVLVLSSSLLAALYRPRLKLAWALAGMIWMGLFAFDLVWLQPFYFTCFLYSWYLLFFTEISEGAHLETLRASNVGLYFWAGVSKINEGYFSLMLPWLVSPLGNLKESWLIVGVLGAASILIEIGSSVLLTTQGYCRWGAYSLMVLHLSVFIIFGPLGLNHHTSIFPMNFLQIVLLWQLYIRTKPTSFPGLFVPRSVSGALIRLIYIFAPVLSFWGGWNDLFSFRLYSASIIQANIKTNFQGAEKLGETATKIWREANQSIPIPLWSLRDTGFVFLGEDYFRRTYGEICLIKEWPKKESYLVINHSLRYPVGFVENRKRDEIIKCEELEGKLKVF